MSSNRTPTVWISVTAAAPVVTLAGSERSSPATITVPMPATNTIVGIMNARALWVMPSRFSPVMPISTATHNHTVWPCSAGNADVSAATPAAMDTATFST